MTKRDKRLANMRQNPQGWAIDDLKSMADHFGVEWIHDGGSHVVFRAPNLDHLTVPAGRPVKAFYIKRFVALIDQVELEADNGKGTSK
jgi:helix-turn-helix protein